MTAREQARTLDDACAPTTVTDMPEPGDAAGYYEDPKDPRIMRYWTGSEWRDDTAQMPVSENWQRRAYDAANKTHWLFTSTHDARPDTESSTRQRDPRVHHPTPAEGTTMAAGLAFTGALGAYQAMQAGLSWGLIALVGTPYLIGGILAIGAAVWAARRNARQ